MPVTVVSSDPPEAVSAPVSPYGAGPVSPHGAGPDAPVPAAPPPGEVGSPGASAPPPAAPAPSEPAPSASAPDAPRRDDLTEEEDEAPEPVPRGVQRKIDREVRRRHEAERKAAAVEARLQLLEQGYQRPPQAPEPVPLHQQPEPREEDYPSQAEWFRAVRDWDKAQLKQELAREAYQQQVQQMRQAQATRMAQQAEAARQKYADFDQVLDRLQSLQTVPALDACVHESDVGAELAYYLAQHPDEIQRLNALAQQAPLAMAREVGKLEVRLSQPTNGTRASSPASVTTAPPPPPTPVSGAGTLPPTGYREDMSQAEFNAMFPYSRRGR